MLKYLYNNFWYPVLGKILSKFIFLIEGNKIKNNKDTIDKSKKIKK